jgi:uncharacterized membrane protein
MVQKTIFRKALGWFLVGFVALVIYVTTAVLISPTVAAVALGGSAITTGLLFLGAWLIWS